MAVLYLDAAVHEKARSHAHVIAQTRTREESYPDDTLLTVAEVLEL